MTQHSKNWASTRYILKKVIVNQNSEEELDATFLVCGEEGSGKSNTILSIVDIWEEQTGKQIVIETVSRNLRELFRELKKHQKHIVALDEGYELKNTNMWDEMVKKIEKAFMLGRYRANISLIAYTNPFKINSYFKEDRAKGIFFCYKRKIVLFYTRKALREVRAIMNKTGNIKSIDDLYDIPLYRSKATFIEYGIKKYKGHLAEEYKKRKVENYLKEMEEMEEEQEDMKTYSMRKACLILRVAKETILNAIENKVIEPEWNATHTKMLMNDKDLEILKEYLKARYSQESNKTTRSYIYDKFLKQNPETETFKQEL